MATYSFDIVSVCDKAEMNNVYMQTAKELGNRFDFKGTNAAIDWLDDKKGFKLTGDGDWQVDAVLDIVRKKLASREQSIKALDLSNDKVTTNLKTTWDLPFKDGLDQDVAKKIAADIRAKTPKAKPQIQGQTVRVTSSSKDDLQNVITTLKQSEYDVALQFINYR